MKYRWIFVAVSLFLINILIVQPAWLAFLALTYWLVRLLILRNKNLLLIIFSLTVLLNIRIWLVPRESNFPTELSHDLVYVKPSTYRVDGDRLSFEGKSAVYKEDIIVHYTISSEQEKETWQRKMPQVLEMSGQLSLPSSNRNIHQFNYKDYLKRQQIHYVFKADILVSASHKDSLPINFKLDYLRARIIRHLDYHFTGPVLSYIKALLFADTQSLEVEILDLYKSLGIIHLISISGLHVDLIIKTIKKLLTLFKLSRERSDHVLITILPTYLLLTGLGVSVFRAVVSNSLKILFKLLKLDLSKSDTWSITLILAILINPFVFYSIGFQLSYGISGLLILISETKSLAGYSKIRQLLLINLLINLFSIPIISYHYFEFPLIALALNLFYVPVFSTLVFPLVVGTLVIGLAFPGSRLAFLFVYLANQIIIMTENILAGVRELTPEYLMGFIPGRLNPLIYLVLGVGLLLIFSNINRPKSKYLTIGLCLYLLSININRLSPIGSIYMLDVGQGDSIVIKPPFSNRGILIDTGGQFSWQDKETWQVRKKPYQLADNEIIPTLKSLGIQSLETIYISHGDYDHVGELDDLLNGFPVGQVVGTSLALESDLLEDMREREDIKFIEANIPSSQTSLGVELLALHPQEALEDSNDASLVLYGKFGRDYWLFTGDLEAEGEKELIKNYPNLQVDTLKVGHHGSETSTSKTFVNHYKPHKALVSVGETNRYGHPHQSVIVTLEDYGTEIYRTDLQGGILYRYSNFEFLNNLFCQYKTVK